MFAQVTTNQAQSVMGFHGVYWLTPSGRLESHISGSRASEERVDSLFMSGAVAKQIQVVWIWSCLRRQLGIASRDQVVREILIWGCR